jgi:hypothetical protein
VLFQVGFRAEDVGDLLLRARCDGLIELEFRDRRLVRGGYVFVVVRHGRSFGRQHAQRTPLSWPPETEAVPGR